jgi:hypothetical protein
MARDLLPLAVDQLDGQAKNGMHIMSESTYSLSGGARVVRRDVTFIFHGWHPVEIEEGHTMLGAPSEEDVTYVHATFVFRGDRPYSVLFAGVEQAFEPIPPPRLMRI